VFKKGAFVLPRFFVNVSTLCHHCVCCFVSPSHHCVNVSTSRYGAQASVSAALYDINVCQHLMPRSPGHAEHFHPLPVQMLPHGLPAR
jgi:hypothetical protein